MPTNLYTHLIRAPVPRAQSSWQLLPPWPTLPSAPRALTAGVREHHLGYSSQAVEEPLRGTGSGSSQLSGGNSHPPGTPRTGPRPGKAGSAPRGQGYVSQASQAGGTPSPAPRPRPHQALVVLTVDADMAFPQHDVADVLEVTEVGPWHLAWPVHGLVAQLLGLCFLRRGASMGIPAPATGITTGTLESQHVGRVDLSRDVPV